MFANNSEFFDGSHGQSVIVRQPPQQQQQPPSSDDDFGPNFPGVGSSSCLPSTPVTPGYSGYHPPPFPFPFLPPEFAQTFQSMRLACVQQMNFNQQPGCSYQPHVQQQGWPPMGMFPPPDHGCGPGLANLNSPLLSGPLDLGGGLNQLNNRFGGVGRAGLPYDFPGGANFMGGAKPRKGGRRPGDEMVEDMDPEEAEKRLKRRQRNKEAAARCRQRRLDLMQTLQEQVQQERDRNTQKEKEITAVRQALEKVVDFLRGHLSHLPENDRLKFEEIVAGLHKDQPNGHVFKIEPLEPLNDYQPQHQQPRQAQKRSALPATSDISILEPELKAPKFETPSLNSSLNPTLSEVNGGLDVPRPTTLDFSGVRGANAPLATPSNGLTSYVLPSFNRDGLFSSLYGGVDGASNFLNGSTGLTPSGAPAPHFVVQTPTPLQPDSELRPL